MVYCWLQGHFAVRSFDHIPLFICRELEIRIGHSRHLVIKWNIFESRIELGKKALVVKEHLTILSFGLNPSVELILRENGVVSSQRQSVRSRRCSGDHSGKLSRLSSFWNRLRLWFQSRKIWHNQQAARYGPLPSNTKAFRRSLSKVFAWSSLTRTTCSSGKSRSSVLQTRFIKEAILRWVNFMSLMLCDLYLVHFRSSIYKDCKPLNSDWYVKKQWIPTFWLCFLYLSLNAYITIFSSCFVWFNS